MRRIKITEFVSRFVEEPSAEALEKGIYEFKIDKDLKSKLDSYKSVFMSVLIDYYKIYREEGLFPPEPVQQVTKKYENDNNIIKQFIDENVITGSKHESITKDQLKDIFKVDYTLRSTFHKFTAFYKQLENALCVEFKPDKKNVSKIIGWKIRDHNAEQQEDDLGETDAESQ